MKAYLLIIAVITLLGIQSFATTSEEYFNYAKQSRNNCFAKSYESLNLDEISRGSEGRISCLEVYDYENLPRTVRTLNINRSEVKFMDVTLTQSGTLNSVLGDEINNIDSLVVRGPINGADFYTMWSGSFYGRLTVINLEYSSIQNNKLPMNAFWYQSEQYTPGSDYIDCISLRRIILPEGLEEIGDSAFGYAIKLEDINLPSSLRTIKRRCFSDCISLNVDPLVIPEGVEEIGYISFVNCKALTGKVVLPKTLKKINGGAFFSSKITECNFPEGLEEIGDAAFYATRLKEAILPNSCQNLSGTDHFALNYELEKVRLPEGLYMIPESFVDNCIKLKDFIMPSSVREIGDRAFWQCGELKELQLPLNLKSVGTEGLYYCKGLKAICFPSTLETLGAESCEYWKNIECIYCAAKIPPACINSELNPGYTPFGKYGDVFVNRTPRDIPVYVPIGTAELYRNAYGWDYFTNFIETDTFPTAGIYYTNSPIEQDTIIYDLLGRKVDTPVPGHLYIENGKKIIK